MDIDPSVTDTNLDSKLKNLELLGVETARLTALIEFKPEKLTNDINLLDTQTLIYQTKRVGYHQQIQLIKEQINQVNSQIHATKEDMKLVNYRLNLWN